MIEVVLKRAICNELSRSVLPNFKAVFVEKIQDNIINQDILLDVMGHPNISVDKAVILYNTLQKKKIELLRAKIVSKDIKLIFVAAQNSYNQLRMNEIFKSFKKKSAQLFLGPKDNMQNFSNLNICLNLYELTLLIKQIKNMRIFSQGWLFRYHINFLIEICKGTNFHTVDIMDLNSVLFPNYKDDSIKTLMEITWGKNAISFHELQLFCENYIFSFSDRVLFPGSLDYSRVLNLDTKLDFKIFFPYSPYPQTKNFSRLSYTEREVEEFKFAFAGFVPPKIEARPREFFNDAQYFTTAELILRQGFCLHVYNDRVRAKELTLELDYREHECLVKSYPNYKFSLGSYGTGITQKLSEYDFGLMIYDFKDIVFGENHFRCMIPSKFFLYVEACLPILVSNKFTALSELVFRHKIGIIFDEDDLFQIKNKLLSVNVLELKKNMNKYRKILANFNNSRFLLE